MEFEKPPVRVAREASPQTLRKANRDVGLNPSERQERKDMWDAFDYTVRIDFIVIAYQLQLQTFHFSAHQ